MTIASLKNLIVEFGDRRVIDQVSVLCEEGAVIGLIGGNGAGKSTLLNVLSGRLQETSGERFLHPKARIGYLLQNSGLSGGRSMIEELRSVVQEGLDAIERLPVTSDPREYARLQAIIDATDAYQIDVRIKTVLNGMGFADYDLTLDVAELSGGEQTRLALCKLLIEQPNLLLLDEPTNHLDFRTLTWLEEYIQNYKGSVILVSHDRFFLDRCVTEIWDMEEGTVRCYPGNYTAFKEQKELWLKEQERLFEQQEKEVAKLTDYIDRNLVRASTSAMAKSRRKQLEKMELIEKPHVNERRLHLKFPVDQGGGNDVLQCRDLTVSVGEDHRLFTGLSFRMQKGEKIAIVGDNGTGKTTLLSVLMGELEPLEGHIRWGANIQTGIFRQATHFINDDHTVLEELGAIYPQMTYQQLRSILAAVSFIGEEVELKVGTLSGGERARFQFAALMPKRCNTLLFDEPTNHLDLPAREEVERALADFTGNLLVVSHDRYFLSHVPTRILKLTPGGLVELKRLEDYWEEEKEELPPPVKEKKAPPANYKSKEQRAREAARRQELSKIEKELAEVEEQIAEWTARLEDAGADYKVLEECCRELEALRALQEELTENWLLLNEEN
ncbi:MAG: ABC-F family ATP-binding cassette domain-containing protein [Clostridia bacterium]|nr:ABC-F family ATP-binding cassette domain-containing protein [Clostridia bacterium]